MRLILFFSYGVSLNDWKKSGLFEREIKFYKYLKNTKNIDISSLKNILRQKINKNDFDIISGHLDDFQAKSYSQLKGDKDFKTIVSSLKIVLNKVDIYV